MKKIKSIIDISVYLISLMFKTSIGTGIVYWLVTFVINILPLLNLWIWKYIIDEFARIQIAIHQTNIIFILIILYVILNILISAFSILKNNLYNNLYGRISHNIERELIEKIACVNASFWDDPQNVDIIETLNNDSYYVTCNIMTVSDIIAKIITFISTVYTFIYYDIILGCLYIITFIPGFILAYKNQKESDQWAIDSIPQNRTKNYYKSLLTEERYAKELRIYNSNEYFKKIYHKLWENIRKKRSELFGRHILFDTLSLIITHIGIVTAIITEVYNVAVGHEEIGSFVLCIGLMQSIGVQFESIMRMTATYVGIDIHHIRHLLDYMHIHKDFTFIDHTEDTSISNMEIEFQNVSFRYPGTEEYVLNNISFKVGDKERIAIIGDNGAGKSTIVKLLLRFYEPECGQIYLGGRDIREYALKTLYRCFSVCFQAVNTYSMSLKMNIVLSDVDRKADIEAINKAVEVAGVNQIIDNIAGLDVELTRLFYDDGMELSGGQKQKIALARAFFRKSNIVILDEPTSSLDPEAESELLASFDKLCDNKSCVMISHRMSLISLADRIILIEKGKVVENGSHDELMRQNGRYAQLYNLQAKGYSKPC